MRPLGLVLKAGSWHLVHANREEVRVRCIDDLRATRITTAPFDTPHDFALATFWEAHVETERHRSSKLTEPR